MEEFRRILVFAKDCCGNGSGSNRYGKEFHQINDYRWNGAGCAYSGQDCIKTELHFDESPFGLKYGGDCLDATLLNGNGFGMGV